MTSHLSSTLRRAPVRRLGGSIRAEALGALLLAALGCGAAGCVGTPLPDPPSLSEALVTLAVTPEVGTVRFVGRPGAVDPAGATLRITDPPMAGVLVATNGDGSFGRVVDGAPTDVFYVELVLATEDRFVGAYTAGPGGTLTRATAGLDGDGDGTPDVIDCAPADRTQAGQRCGSVCTTDSDCAAGQACVAGVCAATSVCVAETCNAMDDDCNGLVDDGDPGGGVPCTPTTGACHTGTITCGSGGVPSCIPDTPAAAETCGNGIDDDCNGVIDDGC